MFRHFQLVAMLLLVLALGLAACGGGTVPTEEAPAEPTETPTSLPLGFEPVTRNADWEPIIQDFDGVEMALVPAGCFMMGSESGDSDEQPVHEVCFDEPFWIDVYEVTNAQFGSAASDCTEWSSDDNQPRICVNWYDAAAHCESREARLPTEAEWEYAARGPDGLVYPWGNEFVADNVVYDDNSGGETASGGSQPGGVSWVGAYDLSGNVWEWVADWYGAYPSTAQVNPSGPGSGDYRVFRGGSWHRYGVNVRAANRYWILPGSSYSYRLGFRCARDY